MSEPLRRWTETAETYFLEIIFEQRRGRLAAFIRGLLHTFSYGYRLAIKIRRVLYDTRIVRDTTLGVQVIAIGNLTVGLSLIHI